MVDRQKNGQSNFLRLQCPDGAEDVKMLDATARAPETGQNRRLRRRQAYARYHIEYRSPAGKMEASFKAGIDDYITKPIAAKKLKAVLEKHLRSKTKA
ncbi:MAG: hypothetical protein EOM12_07190 [Verrucomicrobiae bacterium]|nr:hypothetical protein [Verrucomicrobiae bacterium]